MISIHALRVEGDITTKVYTLSLDISIHALRVEGDLAATLTAYDTITGISIHALRVEGDTKHVIFAFVSIKFLSTPSGWRATLSSCRHLHRLSHFYPRPPGGGRHTKSKSSKRQWDFYPRPPGGGRHSRCHCASWRDKGFLSTPSGWRATGCDEKFFKDIKISIHALRVEGDQRFSPRKAGADNFYPRPPGGGRPQTIMSIAPKN